MKRIPLLALLMVFLGGTHGNAAIRYVNYAAPGGDGTTWANAFKSLQSALNVAVSGDEIWVAKGTYKPSSSYDLGSTDAPRNYHFRMINGVAIYGGFAGTETTVSQRTNFRNGETNGTILSGDIGTVTDYTDNCYHVIYIPGGYGLTLTAVLDGFTISDGNANGGIPYNNGGGLYITGGSCTLNNVAFYNNRTTGAGGGLYLSGAATGNTFNITNFSIYNNIGVDGGGINLNVSGSTLNLTNGLVYNNTASGYGGGIEAYPASTFTFTNVTFANNSAASGGGGVDSYNCDITLKNCIIWGNTTSGSGAQLGYYESGTTTLNNSCYSNGAGDVSGTVTADINCTTSDPKFVNAAGGDFRIYGNSPCVNTGKNSYITVITPEITKDIRGQDRIQNTTIDMGAYEWTTGVDPTVPSATTNAATAITTSSATLNGTINANLSSTTVTFEYGTSVSYGTTVTAGQSPVTGSTATAVSKSISGLLTSTTYYYRVVGVNGAGTTNGSGGSFTTAATNSTFQTAGNWSLASNWSAGIPGSTTEATISANCTVDGNFATGNLILSATGALTIPTGNTLTVNGELNLESDDEGTASLINNGTLSATGTIKAQRYMTGGKWHIVSPTAAGGTVAAFLTANGNIPTSGTNRGMMDYYTDENRWNTFYPSTGASGTMVAGKGYSARITADGVVTFSGTLTSGTKTVTLTKVGADNGWNCIGNPYPSAINMNTSAHATNNFITQNSGSLDGSYACVYVWDEDPSYSGQNCYKIISNSSFSLSGKTRLPMDYVAPGQGFFVKTATNGNTVQFTAAMQVHQTSTALKSGEKSWPGFELTATTAQAKAATIVAFNSKMTNGLDVTYDAGLLRGSSGLELYSRLVTDNGVDFAIQCLPESYPEYSGLVIPLGLDCKTGGEVTFSAETVELPAACSVILEDKTSKTFTSLTGGATYKATVPAGATGTGRFYIHTNDVISGVSDLQPTSTLSLKVYPANGEIIIEGAVSNQAKASLFDLSGKKLGEYTLQGLNRNTISVAGVVPGVYLLNVTDSGKRFNTKVAIY